MTDNEIIKALKCCPYQRDCVSCDVNACDNSPNHIMKCALDLINRQKAEIENYSHNNKTMSDSIYKMQKLIESQKAEIERLQKTQQLARAEAIKEFAERLKEKALSVDVSYGYGREVYTDVVAVIEIDNLVKEMVDGLNQ